MTNLVEALTPNYFREFLRGSLFAHDNKVCLFSTVSGNLVEVNYITLDDSKERESWKSLVIPADTFKSFCDIAWPKLGYRNLDNEALGNCVTFVGTARSTMRGLRDETLTFNDIPVIQCTGYSSVDHMPAGWNGYRYKQIFKPTWIGFSEGMKQIRNGEWSCFAMNEDVAIGLSVDQAQDRFCDIYFREKVVGWIGDDGRVEIANRVIKRGHMKAILNLLESK